ncbi:MAG: DUF538 domain-containing protein [Deltaproteobacteria bacterium]|nr:DUF538 domain-containing protein [Deltaproteobacteria bacterium]
MVLSKEPPEAVDAKKTAKKDAARDPIPANKAKKTELKEMRGGYAAQARAVSAREQVPKQGAVAAVKSPDPIGALQKAFRDMDLPEKLAPTNVESVDYDPKTGDLSITLKSGFSKRFDEENTITFEKNVSGNLTRGAFSGISGIRRGSASIVSISRKGPGVVAIRGKLGPFSKTLEFRDEQLPNLP